MTYVASGGDMSARGPGPDTLDEMVQDGLFLVLRYAVSRETRDRQAVLDQAMKMDILDKNRAREVFRFFRSHSERLCIAIAAPDTPDRRQMLMAHADRIGQRRLRQAFLLTLPARIGGEGVSGTWQNKRPL